MSTPARRPLVLASLVALLISAVAVPPAALAKPPAGVRVAGLELEPLTVPELQDLMDRHRLSSVQLVQLYLRRIDALNPTLKAVITVSPTALADGRAADRARRAGTNLPLLGIPVLIKDNVNTTGMPTTAGSWALAGSTPDDAFIVERLRAAGAVILGKANLSEWANFRSIPSSSGWSGIGGQGTMPYEIGRNPCGSSSGSAVAVAAHLATLAVGTETDGSIVCPAGTNAVVGIKPTVGLLSREGIIPITADQDTAGPMARSVTDAAVMLGAMKGVDAQDPATVGQPAVTDYTAFLDATALDGARIGIWREGTYDPTTSPEIHSIMNATAAVLEAQGAVVVDPLVVPIGDAYEPEFTALLCEFRTDIAAYLGTYTGTGYPKTLADLIAFNHDHPELEGDWNDAIFELANETGGRTDPACVEARAAANAIARASIDDLMASQDLDAIVAPTNGPAWMIDPVNGDLGGDFSLFVGSSTPAAVAGYPAITVPAGSVGGLPIGVSFIAGRWQEPEIIAFAFDFEQATGARWEPTLGRGPG